jgi:hypothetical protein
LEKDVETMFNGQKVKKMVFGWEAYTLHGGYVHVAPNSRDDIALIKYAS